MPPLDAAAALRHSRAAAAAVQTTGRVASDAAATPSCTSTNKVANRKNKTGSATGWWVTGGAPVVVEAAVSGVLCVEHVCCVRALRVMYVS